MLRGLATKLFGRGSDKGPEPMPPQPDMERATETLDPGPPYSHGETVPRWPEQGAALVAASPEALIETQRELIRKIQQFSPLTPQQFQALVVPVFHRYAAWVHLLPASEEHHHFGPGGLLTHGFEVALHAARMAEGKLVGTEHTPSERNKYQPRWRIATMLGGLFHDLGKPLVDSGATCVHGKLTWPSMDVSLYDWLKANNLTHYRIYWRPGKRHERHKAVGTAVVREILGPEMLAWLADEPKQEVTSLLMVSVAQGKSTNNLMSVIISNADSLSVEADLKRLASKQQATGQAGMKSVAALVMGELRRLIENNKMLINKPGAKIWHTTAGTFGTWPYVLDEACAELVSKQVSGLPAIKMEVVQLLADSGFVEACVDEESKNSSLTWNLTVDLMHKDQVQRGPEVRVIKFTDTEFLFGALPLPKEVDATCTPPFMTADAARSIAAGVQVADEPQSVESALGQAVAATVADRATDPSAPPDVAAAPAPSAPNAGPTESAPQPTLVAQDRRNRRDIASDRSVEDSRRRERNSQQDDAQSLLAKLEGSGFAGPSMAEVIRRIAARKLVWGSDACESTDGLIVRYPLGLERLGIPPQDLLPLIAQAKWLVTDAGSDRQVADRTFPNGQQSKCIVLGGLVQRTWERVRDEYVEILEGKPVNLLGDDSLGEAAPPKPAPPHQQQAKPNEGQSQASGGSRRHEPATTSARTSAPQRQGQGAGDGSRSDKANGQPQAPGSQRKQNEPRPDQQQRAPAPAQSAKAAAFDTGRTEQRERPQKATAPAVGAAPVPDRGNGGRQEMSFEAPPGSQAVSKPVPAAMPSGQPSYSKPRFPRGMEDLVCTKLDDITPQKAEWINGIVMRVIGMWLHKQSIDVKDVSQPDAATIMTLLKSFLQKNDVIRPAPFVTALAVGENPLFLFKKPASLKLEDIQDIRRNPKYAAPTWVFNPPGRAPLLPPEVTEGLTTIDTMHSE